MGESSQKFQWKNFVFPMFAICISCFSTLLALEIILRFVPVHNGPNAIPVDHSNPIHRFEPHKYYTFSKGPLCKLRQKVKTNNLGFVNEIDYDTTQKSPIIGIIGDSYVEALMVAHENKFSTLLARSINQAYPVYTFASSGSGLSEYLAYAEYIAKNFIPRALIILVIANDFDQSYVSYRIDKRFHYFIQDSTNSLTLMPGSLQVRLCKKVMRNSALINYVFRNLEIRLVLRNIQFFFNGQPKPEEYIDQDSNRVVQSKKVIEAFLSQLPVYASLPPEKILIIVDANRQQIYSPAQQESGMSVYFDQMRNYLVKRAHDSHYAVLDLHEIFKSHYSTDHKSFEYPNDGHWNEYSHNLCAQALVTIPFFSFLK